MQETLEKFLRMPITKTKEVFEEFMKLKGAIKRGEGLESFVYIRGSRKNKVLLVAHADTVWNKNNENIDDLEGQKLIFENGRYRNLNGGLGADDRAGCAILWILKDLGHSILVTSGEEMGQMASNFLIKENQDLAEEINTEHQFIVEFDRRNSKDYKCYEVGTDEFRKYIETVTGYKEPNRRSATDIRILCQKICGVNLSIGFYNEHSEDEYLVYEEWLSTLKMAQKWLSRDDLPKFELQKSG